MRARTVFSMVIAAALLFFALPPHGGLPALASGPQPKTLKGVVPPGVQHAQLVGRHNAQDKIGIAVALSLRDPSGLDQYLANVDDPSSPSYHQFLTQDKANQAFNPTADQEQQVVSWLTSNGLKVTGTYPNHLLVDAEGASAQIESLLQVTMNDYEATIHGKPQTFYAPANEPTIGASVSDVVTTVVGLDNYPRFFKASNGTANSKTPYYPQNYANAYNVNPLWNAGYTGSGQHIGITLWTVPPSDSTLQHFGTTTGAAVATTANGKLNVVKVDGGTTASASPDDGEAGMDIEYSGGIAPDATIDYYEAPTDSYGNPTDQGLLDALNQAGTASVDNRQITNSWGGCEASPIDSWTQSAENIFKSNAATGHNYFFSSGDSGSSCDIYGDGTDIQNPYPDYPASSPNVTSVGGTRFSTTAGASYPGEVAWAYCGSCGPEGSGGGYSKLFSRPSWQGGTGLAANGERGYPDISADADPATGAYVCYGGSSSCYQFGGTSLSSPLWAGMTALFNQYLVAQSKPSLGFLAPDLYNVATHTQPYAPFHDITSGNNGHYYTSTAWDAVTGWGSTNAWNLAQDLAGTGSTSTGGIGVELISNGGFESGTSPWVASTSNSAYPIIGTSDPHSGSYNATMCGFNSCIDRLSQVITVPSSYSSLTLTYWVYVSTHEVSTYYCYDAMSVQLFNSSGYVIATPQTLCSSKPTNGYVQETVNLSTTLAYYKGKQVKLTFYAHTNSTNPTSFYLDDVSLTAATSTSTVPTATPRPTATPTSTTSGTCSATSPDACASAMLTMLNTDRANYAKQYNLTIQPLSINWTQTHGNSTCVGSIGHSKAMAASGTIWHTNPNYPAASFPNDICIAYSLAGENVGEDSTGNETKDLQTLNSMMMNETHSPTSCASTVNHACNIVNANFHQVGIGVYYPSTTTWLTQDFTN